MEDVDCCCVKEKFEMDIHLYDSSSVVAKKRMATKLPKARKVTIDPGWWPFEYEDINDWCALVAIQYGNASILARYLREVNEIDPRVRRSLAEILNSSNLFWRLYAQYRFRGTPSKQAKDAKAAFVAATGDLAELLFGTNPIDARCRRALAEMLDFESRHPLLLDFKQRKRGRPGLAPQLWPPLVPRPLENDAATLSARRAIRIRSATGSGRKVPHKQLHDDSSHATHYRRLKLFSESGLKRPFAKGQSKNNKTNVSKSMNC